MPLGLAEGGKAGRRAISLLDHKTIVDIHEENKNDLQ
jgi:hypothetical protein